MIPVYRGLARLVCLRNPGIPGSGDVEKFAQTGIPGFGAVLKVAKYRYTGARRPKG